MRIPFRKYKLSWFAVFCSAGILAIVACNVYLLCCGRCVINDYLRIPLIGWLIIAANLIAALILFVVKRKSKQKPRVDSCSSCRIVLRDSWVYCPNCGGETMPGQGAGI